MTDDLISRQGAIDAFTCKGSIFTYGANECKTIVSRIMALPSAQPEHCGDAVSRNAIVQKLNKMDRYVSTELRLCDTDKKFPQNEVFIVDDVYEIIEQLPPVQPEQRWIPVTEESVIQAGYEGREVRFRLRGRLFAIRELAQ